MLELVYLMTAVIRSDSHEIDTLARRRLSIALPAAWEHRELTGRDYGIDMIVEVFDAGRPTGITLMVQIKGTTQDVLEKGSVISFDVPVKTLKYSEYFIAPVLLAICPVNKDDQFFYLWLQEYIKVVLNFDNPNWRQNTSSVRVHIPVENKMPGRENCLKFIGNFPQRINDWVQAGRFHHTLRCFISDNSDGDWLTEDFLKEALFIYDECLSLKALFGDPGWKWGQSIRKEVIEPGIRACEMVLHGGPFSKDQLGALGKQITAENPSQDYLRYEIGLTILTMADRLFSAMATANDYALKRSLWMDYGDHDF